MPPSRVRIPPSPSRGCRRPALQRARRRSRGERSERFRHVSGDDPAAAGPSRGAFAHLGDDELADRWLAGTLGGTGIGHLDHVRVGWVLVRRLGPDAAADALVEGTRGASARYGVAERFDEPLTRRWAAAIAAAAGRHPAADSFAAFRRRTRAARLPPLRRAGVAPGSRAVRDPPTGHRHDRRFGAPSGGRLSPHPFRHLRRPPLRQQRRALPFQGWRGWLSASRAGRSSRSGRPRTRASAHRPR